MKFCRTTFPTLIRPALIGLVGVGVACLTLRAGQPIQFSNPKDDVDLPPRREYNIKLPSPTLQWPTHIPEDEVMMPPPARQIDPRLEKKWREMQEEKKNWLFNEPALFKERFPDPFQKPADNSADPAKSLDVFVDRILGKSTDAKQEKKTPAARTTDSYSDEPRFDARKKPTLADPTGSREKGEREDGRPATEWSMKNLFEPAEGKAHLPVQPGMSLYEMLGTTTSKVQKREEEARRQEFSRMLGGVPLETTPPSKMLESIISQDDPARGSLIQPITPVLGGGLPALKTSTERFPAPSGLDRPTRPVSFDGSIGQPQVTAQRPVEKSSQMEALKLRSRPAILEFPGRRF